MKIVKTILIFALFVGLDACVNPPNFPVTPEIHFQSIDFYSYSDSNYDTLKVTVTFKDGDGDLGFDKTSDTYNSDPYNQRTYFIGNSATGKITPVQTTIIGENLLSSLVVPEELLCSTCKLVTWKTKNSAPFDTVKMLPAYQVCFPYQSQYVNVSLSDISIATGISGFKNGIPNKTQFADTIAASGESVIKVQDTLFYKPNPNFYNFDIEFLNASDDSPIDWWTLAGCDQLPSGRFGAIPSGDGPVEGTLLYNINTSGLKDFIGYNNPIKLRVRIRDRALHVSNTITTLNGFTLNKIKKN